MSTTLSIEQITELTKRFREYLEPCWRQFHEDYGRGVGRSAADRIIPSPLSKFTCRHTSAFILKQLVASGVNEIAPAGGWMRHAALPDATSPVIAVPNKREVDASGYVWEPHFWLEHNGFIIDVTKDQFGWDAEDVSVIDGSEQVYRKLPEYSRSHWLKTVRTTVGKFEGVTTTWAQDANPHYQETRERFAVLRECIGECVANEAKVEMRL